MPADQDDGKSGGMKEDEENDGEGLNMNPRSGSLARDGKLPAAATNADLLGVRQSRREPQALMDQTSTYVKIALEQTGLLYLSKDAYQAVLHYAITEEMGAKFLFCRNMPLLESCTIRQLYNIAQVMERIELPKHVCSMRISMEYWSYLIVIS